MASSKIDLLHGQARLERGEFEEAFRFLKAASEAVPRDPEVPAALCEFARQACNHAGANRENTADSMRLNELAIQAFALRADTVDGEYERRVLAMAVFNLATSFDALGQEAEAIEHYQRGLTLMPDFEGGAMNLAYLLVEADRADEAAELLSAFVAKSPENGQLTAQLIMVLQQARRMEEAMALARQSAARFPNLRFMHFGYHYRYAKNGVLLTA